MMVLGIILMILGVLAAVWIGETRGHFVAVKEIEPYFVPPRAVYRIYGTWPNNLICYGAAATAEEADRKIEAMEAALREAK